MLSNVRDNLPEFGRLSAVPAHWIENTYLTEPQGGAGKFWKETKVRALFIGMVAAGVVDMASAAGAGVRYGAGVFLRSDKRQDAYLKQLKKFGTIFSKNLYAILGLPVGLVSPKLISLHFTVEKPVRGVRSGGGGHSYEPNVTVEYPEFPQEVAALVKTAAKKNQKLMPIGAGRSQGRQFIPAGLHGESLVALDLREMNAVQIDAKAKTATIGAGAHWDKVQMEADEHGLALQTMQASNVFSGGGSVGTNIHGWNIHTGMLSNTVLSMDVVKANGELVTLTPDDKLFHAVTGGLGLYGVVTSLKLQLTDNEWLKEVGTEVKLGDYPRYFHEKVLPNKDIRMHLFRLSLDPDDLLGSGVAVDYVPDGEAKQTRTPELMQESTYGSRKDQIMVNIARRVGKTRKQYWETERERLLANNSPPQTTNTVMQPVINSLFHDGISEAEWLQEYFLPGDKLQVFLHALGKLLMINEVALLNASVRFVKQNNKSALSYAYDGDRFAVVLCFTQLLQPSQVVKASKWLREAQKLAVDMGGTYYLPYQHVADPEVFHRSYPHAYHAAYFKQEVDPQEIFTSGFYQKYLAPCVRPVDPKPDYFRELVKSEQIKERFKGFLRVVLQRVEANQLFDLLEDILQYKDSHAEIYQELCNRLPQIAPGMLADFVHVLNSLAAIKHDLGEQAAVLLDGVKEIHGLVEVGYPGRFVEGFENHFKVTGKIVAVYEGPSLSDYVQTGFRRAYNQFAKLDYRDPDLHTLHDNSADLITCYVGLHHFPEHKVAFFLNEVRRVLRPGGHFLLVDHDVRNEEDLAMAHGAHMIFNAVTGVSLQDELSETRLFRSMEYWQRMLAQAGLGYHVAAPEIDMIRDGDPSRNRMVCFRKPLPSLQNQITVGEGGLGHQVTTRDWRKPAAVSVGVGSMFKEEKGDGAPVVSVPSPASGRREYKVN